MPESNRPVSPFNMEVNIGWGNAHTKIETIQGRNKTFETNYRYNIGKILDTTNLKILNCLQTSNSKKIPTHYVPGCHRIIKHGGFSQVVSIKPKTNQSISTMVAMISNREEVEIIERREDEDAL